MYIQAFHRGICFTRIRLLEKDTSIKRFQYLPLVNESKKQTGIVKKQHQGLGKVFEFDKKEDDERINKKPVKKYSKSDLIYRSKFSFYKYCNIKRFNSLSFESYLYLYLFIFIYLYLSLYSYLLEIKYDADNLNNLKLQNENTKKKKIDVYDTALELYNELLEIYFDELNDL